MTAEIPVREGQVLTGAGWAQLQERPHSPTLPCRMKFQSKAVLMEAKLKHLEFMQGVINRLATDSFRVKGWVVVLVPPF